MISENKIKNLQKLIGGFNHYLAYKELFIIFYAPLLQFADSYIHSREEAEEIVSEMFHALWEKRKDIQKITNLRLSLYIAIRDRCTRHLQENKGVNAEGIDPQPKSFCLDPRQMMVTAKMTELIRSAIHKLPQQTRMVFKLLREDRLNSKEVATILQLSQKTVESQLALALEKIAEVIRFDIGKTVPATQRHMS
jgi:RNA polymerase sigma-70 factor (family 1)